MSSIQPLGCPKRPLKLTRKDRSKTPTFTGLLTKILSCVITVIRRLHPKCQEMQDQWFMVGIILRQQNLLQLLQLRLLLQVQRHRLDWLLDRQQQLFQKQQPSLRVQQQYMLHIVQQQFGLCWRMMP